jgi:hypothetical protein
VYGFTSLGGPFGLILAGLLIVGPIPVLFLALAAWLIVPVGIAVLAFRNRRKLEFGRNQVLWSAVGLIGGVIVGFSLFLGFLYAFQWFVLAVILLGAGSLTRSFLEVRRDWPRVSPPTRKFVRTLLMVNIPTSAFLFSYLIIVFPRINSILGVLLAYVAYVIPNGFVFAKRIRELMSSRPAPDCGSSDRIRD